MKSYPLLVLLLTICFDFVAQNPISNFSTIPASQNGVVSVCTGSAVTFISTSTQVINGATYSWNFGVGASTAQANTTGPFNITYSGTTSYTTTVTLSVNNNNGTSISTSSITISVIVVPTPQISLVSNGNGYSTSNQNGITVFKNCNSSGLETFDFQTNISSGISQSIYWGDGNSSNQNDIVSNQISHQYPVGQYNLNYTISQNGCSASKNYTVFNGNAPIVTVSGSGQNTCLPSPYSIDILANNVPIDYTVSFSDGTPHSQFNTANDTTISHIFNSSSCGIDYVYAPGVPPIENAFSASVIAQNACSSNGLPTVFTIGPITISTGTDAQFSYLPNSPVCQGTLVTFTNQSSGGENISSSGCDSTYSYFWKIEQPNGYTLSSGSFGTDNGSTNFEDWQNGTNQLGLTFDTPGTYQIWLYTSNFCGKDSLKRNLTVKPTATVITNDPEQLICSGDTSSLVTFSSSVPGYTVIWELTDIQNVNGYGGLTDSDTTSVSLNEMILMNGSNQLGTLEYTVNVACPASDPLIYHISVNPEANINVTPQSSFICSGEETDIAMTSNIDNATFSWIANTNSSITGYQDGSGEAINQVLTSTSSSTDTVYYTISVSNVACPDSSKTVYVTVQPPLQINSNQDVNVCPGQLVNPDTYTSIPSGATFSWTNSNVAVGLASNGNGNVPSWTAAVNSTPNSISSQISVTAQLNNCPSVQDQFIVTVLPVPAFDYALNPVSGLTCLFDPITIEGTTTIPSSVNWTGPFIVSGAQSLTPQVNSPGNYFITMTDLATGCTNTDSVKIDPPNPIKITDIHVKNVSCFNGNDGSIVVQTNNSGIVHYNWSPTLVDASTVNNLSPGSYSVTVANEDLCFDDTTVLVQEVAPITLYFTTINQSECDESNGSISAEASGGNGGYSYTWSTGQQGSVVVEVPEGNYEVTVTDQKGCQMTIDTVISCKPLLPIIPNQFLSPNKDGKNETWIIQNIETYTENKVTVYNRWGNVVFEAESYKNDWNGCFKGKDDNPLPAATYFYVIDTKKKSQKPFTGYIEIQP
jgi:gliding motility-associated-like protein